MANSKMIAALVGPSLIAGALSIFINLGVWPEIVDEAAQDPALLWVSGWPVFVAGLAIVYFHNQWKGGWPTLVTALGWLAVIGGLARILFPWKVAGIGLAVTAAHTAGVLPIIGTARDRKAHARNSTTGAAPLLVPNHALVASNRSTYPLHTSRQQHRFVESLRWNRRVSEGSLLPPHHKAVLRLSGWG
jgi:hypothetical protein